MSTAKLAVWLHWQATWVRFRDSSSQPLADHPPVPPILRRKGRRERDAFHQRGLGGPAAPGKAHPAPPRWARLPPPAHRRVL